jgi:hypothetical protein
MEMFEEWRGKGIDVIAEEKDPHEMLSLYMANR